MQMDLKKQNLPLNYSGIEVKRSRKFKKQLAQTFRPT